MSDIPLERLLKIAFKDEEWLYLSQNEEFQEQIEKHPKTTDGYERLVRIGATLLRQRQEAKFPKN